MPNASETAIKFIGLHIYFVNECWLRPRIKSARNFQHKPLRNQCCLSQHKLKRILLWRRVP